MRAVSEQDREVAQRVAAVFGGSPTVREFVDKTNTEKVDILRCDDRPEVGLTSHSTVGLYRSPNLLDGASVPVELAGLAPKGSDLFAAMLARAASLVAFHAWLAAPGVVFPDIFRESGLSTRLDHIMWVAPIPWQELSSVRLSEGLTVHWLSAMPITDPERSFLQREGYFRLEELLLENKADLADFGRPSVV